MSTPIEANTAGLQDILNTVFNLPNAGGGGLPAGISALECGTYTAEEDITSLLTIPHNLGERPDFVLFCAEGEMSADVHRTYLMWQISVMHPYSTSSGTYLGTRYSFYFSDQENPTTTSSYGEITSGSITESAFIIYCASYRKLKAGTTYKWLACKFAQ